MAQDDRHDTEGSGAGFVMGLLVGTVLGAGLGMLLALKAGADLREQIDQQARELGSRASERYRRATQTAGDWAERGREMMGQAREAVSRRAEEIRSHTGAPDDTPGLGSTPDTPGGGTDYERS